MVASRSVVPRAWSTGGPSRVLSRLVAVSAVGAMVVAGLLTVPPPARAASTLANTTFYGRGYGHGVGMSQYGARGRALAGQLAPAILSHYYAGTTLGSRDPAARVRVLVLTGCAATAARPLTVTGSAAPGRSTGSRPRFRRALA